MDDADRIREALNTSQTAVIGARCAVEYSGRAESKLATGDRIILVKADNALLVHQPNGNTPVNYMKPQTVHEFVQDEAGMRIKSRDAKRKEYMDILLEKIHFVNCLTLEDPHSIQLQGNEKDFSDYLSLHPELIGDGFVPVSREEQTAYGFVDLFGHDGDNNLVVVECKRFKAGPDAVTQLRRYVEKIKASKGVDGIKGVLVAPAITKNALQMAEDWGFTYKSVEPPRFLVKSKKDQRSIGDF